MASSLAATDAPAAGAALDQVLIATAGGLAVTIAVFVLCVGHRTGRLPLLGYANVISPRLSGMPGWAGLPSLIALVTLLPALFGLQWDEALHIADGRDDGPLANPSHYLLLGGIFGAFAAGVIAIALGDETVPRSGIRITSGWRAPLGGVLITVGAAVGLLGFPLDDLWHRLFGQDVTLWGPTHVAMIGGLSLSVLGALVLNIEGMRVRRERLGPPGERPLLIRALALVQAVMMPAALLLVLSLLQGEFDYGVPQFRLVFHPMLVMAAAGGALVAARIFVGRGAAIGAVLGFLAIRGAIAVIIGPVFGEPWHIFPLYLAEAVIVELVAIRVSPRDALRFALWCGALIGTVGLAAEWAWSEVFRIPWPSELLPEAAVLGLGMALAGSVLGAWLGAHLTLTRFPRTASLRSAALLAGVAFTAMIGYGLIEPEPDRVVAHVKLDGAGSGSERAVNATVRLDPPNAADGADWFRTIAWQGGGLEGAPMREAEPGVYRTAEPLPIGGNWKTAVRLQHGGRLSGFLIYAPEDTAIPAPEVPARPRFVRELTDEQQFLRREAKDVAGWIWTLATVLVAALMFALLAAWAWALHRLADAAPDHVRRADRRIPRPDAEAPRAEPALA
jgi:hypothetical protein